MLEYYLSYYRNSIIFIIMFGLISGGSAYYYLNKPIDDQYYQVYAYPREYKIECLPADVCEEIKKDTQTIENTHLYFIASEYRGSKDMLFATGYTFDLLTQIDPSRFVLNAFGTTFVPKKKSQAIDSGTFQGKALNQMEKNCLETIKNSIIIGSFDAEKIINERFAYECSGFVDENSKALSPTQTVLSEKADITVHISKIALKYKFYKKNKGTFTEIDNKEIVKDYVVTFTGSIGLSNP